jgi:hypothetical protein
MLETPLCLRILAVFMRGQSMEGPKRGVRDELDEKGKFLAV